MPSIGLPTYRKSPGKLTFQILVLNKIWRDLLYSVFTINVPLAVRFATIAIGTRKAESPEYGRFDRDLQ